VRSELQSGQQAIALTDWRRNQLTQSGFPLALASQIAGDEHFDLHALIELAERGCPPELAVRILCPLEGAPPEA
jgi:hypothetical protein